MFVCAEWMHFECNNKEVLCDGTNKSFQSDAGVCVCARSLLVHSVNGSNEYHTLHAYTHIQPISLHLFEF
eukprot:m.143593 g.143593  ORF g.143593 m.143593 type:complete len:70 (+) comp13208_c1_seq2:343-552(+)